MNESNAGNTIVARKEQFRDRWSTFGRSTGILSISERLTPSQLREYQVFQEFDDDLLEKISSDVSVATWAEGSVLFEEGSYIDIGFIVVEGQVELSLKKVESLGDTDIEPIFDSSRTIAMPVARPGAPPSTTAFRTQIAKQDPAMVTFLSVMDIDLPAGSTAHIGAGEIFGEIGALSGWPQSVSARAASNVKLIQLRVPAIRLLKRKSTALRQQLERFYRARSLGAHLKASPLLRGASRELIADLTNSVDLVSFEPGDVIAKEGDPADAIYMVRSGFVKVSQQLGEAQMAVTYLSKGMTFGEIELLLEGTPGWVATASSVEYAELVKITRAEVERVITETPEIRDGLMQSLVDRVREIGARRRSPRDSKFLDVALEAGLVQGSSILVIDLNRCTRCDDCVRGCADTHGGLPRFVREGDKYENLLIAKSCYHCQDPVCLVGCPTGSIRRAGVRDVVEIDPKLCIGCGACARNCPYDAIVMHETGTTWPANMIPEGLRGKPASLASKCDMCFELDHGPACVLSCPNDCAFRVGSLEEIQALLPARRRGGK